MVIIVIYFIVEMSTHIKPMALMACFWSGKGENVSLVMKVSLSSTLSNSVYHTAVFLHVNMTLDVQ